MALGYIMQEIRSVILLGVLLIKTLTSAQFIAAFDIRSSIFHFGKFLALNGDVWGKMPVPMERLNMKTSNQDIGHVIMCVGKISSLLISKCSKLKGTHTHTLS